MGSIDVPPHQARGVLYSTCRNRAVPGRAWGFWYGHTSKKVWFRIDPQAVEGLRPEFSYRRRPILHRSELARFGNPAAKAVLPPVVWGDFVGTGWAAGPAGTQLYLQLWTRWTWLHPGACGRPEQFEVVFRPAR